MKITVIGTGYVGLITGICFAEKGHFVFCVDNNKEKINKLKKGISPIYEPGIDNLLKKNLRNKRIKFFTSLKNPLKNSDICFIAVGTPMNNDGSTNLQYVYSAASDIGKNMTKHTYIIDKSTVPVGTGYKIKEIISRELKIRNSKLTFDIISNPEFLKEGNAIFDCNNPDRIVIGCDNIRSKNLANKIYSKWNKKSQIIHMDILSAELTKYASNAFLATKVSFINEIANICAISGADINSVKLGVGKDKRIGLNFMNPGCGFGGSCFPKDVNALTRFAISNHYKPELLKAVTSININQRNILYKMIVSKFGKNNLHNLTIGIWGLSYKPNTDDMRESPAIYLINSLYKEGTKIKVYDPKAMINAKNIFFPRLKNITYCKNKVEAIKNADCLVLVTEWDEFLNPNFAILKKVLKRPIIFDGRNQYNKNALIKLGFEYYMVGSTIKKI